MASKNNNRQMVPEARQALDDMKFEIPANSAWMSRATAAT